MLNGPITKHSQELSQLYMNAICVAHSFVSMVTTPIDVKTKVEHVHM